MKFRSCMAAFASLVASGTVAFATGEPPSQPAIDPIHPEDIADFPDVNLTHFSHPPSKASIVARVVVEYPNLFEDAGREMGLSPNKHRRLVDLLIDQHVEALWPDFPMGASEKEWTALRRAMVKKHDRQLRNLLGGKGIAALARYRKSIEPRYEVEDMRQTLEASNLKMTEAQRRRMVLAILEPGAFVRMEKFPEGAPAEQIRARVRARVEQNDRQLLLIARDILTPEQWTAYSKYQDERREDTIRFEISLAAADD